MCQETVGTEADAAGAPAPDGPAIAVGAASGLASGIGSKGCKGKAFHVIKGHGERALHGLTHAMRLTALPRFPAPCSPL